MWSWVLCLQLAGASQWLTYFFHVGMTALWPKCNLLSPSIFADADASAANAAAAAAATAAGSAIAYTAATAATATSMKQLGVSL